MDDSDSDSDLEWMMYNLIASASDSVNDGEARDNPSVGPSDQRPTFDEGVALSDHSRSIPGPSVRRPKFDEGVALSDHSRSIPGPSVRRPQFDEGFAEVFPEIAWSADRRAQKKPLFHEVGFAAIFPEVPWSAHRPSQKPTFHELGLAEVFPEVAWSTDRTSQKPLFHELGMEAPWADPRTPIPDAPQDSLSISEGTAHDIVDLHTDFFNNFEDDFHDSDLD